MVIIEYSLLLLLAALCCISSFTDIKYGVVKNQLLIPFSAAAILMDAALYGFLARDIATLFLLNSGVSILVALALFFSNNFAGGDCKLAVVISLLYPAGMYLSYHDSHITLFFGIAFSLFLGYIYLLISSMFQLVTGRTKVDKGYVVGFVKKYLISYLEAFLYVTLVNLLFVLLQYYAMVVPPWLPWFFCFIVVFLLPRLWFLKYRTTITGVVIMDVVLAIYLGVIPLSLNPATYVITAFFLLAQITIRTNIYEEIDTDKTSKGMILASGSSMLFQGVRIDGLPGLSSESLKDRLTDEQATAIREWGNSRGGQKRILIVKKIPFAVFLSLGYLTYYVIWSIVR